jgi:hypothetical protein
MATVKKNIITQGLSGMLGHAIVFRQVGDQTIASTPPTPSSNPPTAKQQAQRQRFQEASLYAKAQLQDPDLKADYEAAGHNRNISAYAVAVADFLQGPDIQEIDLSDYNGDPGDTIKVRVTDGFRVDAVRVLITNGDGSQVEAGDAVQQQNVVDWVYTATANNTSIAGDKITIQALDLPGNRSEAERTL